MKFEKIAGEGTDYVYISTFIEEVPSLNEEIILIHPIKASEIVCQILRELDSSYIFRMNHNVNIIDNTNINGIDFGIGFYNYELYELIDEANNNLKLHTDNIGCCNSFDIYSCDFFTNLSFEKLSSYDFNTFYDFLYNQIANNKNSEKRIVVSFTIDEIGGSHLNHIRILLLLIFNFYFSIVLHLKCVSMILSNVLFCIMLTTFRHAVFRSS